MIKYYIPLCLACFLAVGNSCIDDKGNYDYIEVSRAEMNDPNTVETVYSVPNSQLIIEPIIYYTEGKGYNDYSFEWHLYDGKDTQEVISSSDSPILNIILPPSMNRSGSYTVMFIAKNNQTKMRFMKKYIVVVKNMMQVGYLALSEKSDGLELEMIANFNDTLTFYPNLLQLTNSEYPRKGRKPISLALFSDGTAPCPYSTDRKSIKYSVYIVTDKGTDRLKPEDYSFIEYDYNIGRVSGINSKFIPAGGLIPETIKYQFGSSTHYILMNNNWFFASRKGMLYYFSDPINTPFGKLNYYKAAPYIVNFGHGAVLYDLDRNRFMRQGWSLSDLSKSTNILATRTLVDSEGDKFKFNDPDYTLAYMGNIEQSTNYSTGFAILQHKTTGKHEIWTFKATSTTVTKTDRFIFPASLDFKAIKHFAYHPYAQYLYCATQDKIYALVMTQENPVVVDLSDIIPSGHKISMFKAMHPNKRAVNTAAFCYFALGTYDPAKDLNTCGTLTLFDTDYYTGKFTMSKHPKDPPESGYRIDMQWNGMGKIVDLDYKEK